MPNTSNIFSFISESNVIVLVSSAAKNSEIELKVSLEINIFPSGIFFSISAVMFTVSPQISYDSLFFPTIPAITFPV